LSITCCTAARINLHYFCARFLEGSAGLHAPRATGRIASQ
jgi:hypothetical protein